MSAPIKAEVLSFARLVPTITGRSVLATGNTLRVLLGYDRSAIGEAVVSGHGMPLRDDAPIPPWAAAAAAAAAAASPDADAVRTRGDLIVKFAVTPPAYPRRVAVGAHGLATPPITLMTSGGGPGARAHARVTARTRSSRGAPARKGVGMMCTRTRPRRYICALQPV